MSDEQTPAPRAPKQPDDSNRKTIGAALLWAVGVFAIVLVAWLNLPRLQSIGKQPEAATLPAMADPTQAPTRTTRPTAEPTQTPAPTATAPPTSAYYLADGYKLRPPIPGVEGGAIVLDEVSAAVADPPFDTQYWTSSAQIAAQTGFFIDEPYFATFGSGSVTWSTDVPLATGLYELYVMDTLYSSAGPLDFQVALGGSPISPVLGSSHVEFYSSRGEPTQSTDMWRSIGIYNLDHPGPLSISTQWDARDENSLVAIDRVVIVPLPEASRLLLSALPKDRMVIILDDLAARIETDQLLFPETETLAWGGQFQYLVNPDSDVRVQWTTPEYVLPGQYQVAVWLPAAHASGEVTFHLFVNDKEIPGSEVSFNQGEQPGGQWVAIGVWDTPRVYEKPVMLTLEMDIPGGMPGETAIDAVALIKTP